MATINPITVVDVNEPVQLTTDSAGDNTLDVSIAGTPGIPQLDAPSTHPQQIEYMQNGLESTTNLKVIKAETNGNELFITVEDDSPGDVTDTSSRLCAYQARFQYGFANAGIEAYGGIQIVDGKSRQTWRLTRAL